MTAGRQGELGGHVAAGRQWLCHGAAEIALGLGAPKIRGEGKGGAPYYQSSASLQIEARGSSAMPREGEIDGSGEGDTGEGRRWIGAGRRQRGKKVDRGRAAPAGEDRRARGSRAHLAPGWWVGRAKEIDRRQYGSGIGGTSPWRRRQWKVEGRWEEAVQEEEGGKEGIGHEQNV